MRKTWGTKDYATLTACRPPPAQQAEAEKIAAELAAIAATGMVLPGSITERRPAAAPPTARCHADPPRLHGPYCQWTRKIAGKTICRMLTADQLPDYQPWIDNHRRLRELLARARSPRPRHRRRRPPLGTPAKPASRAEPERSLQIAWAAPA